MADSPFPEIVTGKQLGELLGIGVRRVQQLGKQGVFEKSGRGKYILMGACKAYADHLLESEMGKREKGTNRDSFEFERARQLKIRNDKAESLVIETEIAVGAVDYIMGELLSDMMSIPAQISDDLGVRQELENVINRVLDSFSQRFEEAGTAMEKGINPFEAGEEDIA